MACDCRHDIVERVAISHRTGVSDCLEILRLLNWPITASLRTAEGTCAAIWARHCGVRGNRSRNVPLVVSEPHAGTETPDLLSALGADSLQGHRLAVD